MSEKQNIIEKWMRSIIKFDKLDYSLVDNDFGIEDGMSLEEYWRYEKDSFNRCAKIFDLDEKLTIKIIESFKIGGGKELCFIYVINRLNKIAFKMTITIKNGLLSSNEYFSQIVPKYIIRNNKIVSLGMALSSRFPIVDLGSMNLKKISFRQGDNFNKDKFYYAEFEWDGKTNILNNFYIKYDGIDKIEKRKVFYDKFRIIDKPYREIRGNIVLLDNLYPTAFSATKNNRYEHVEYPRGLSFLSDEYSSLIITDVLDNDWHIK